MFPRAPLLRDALAALWAERWQLLAEALALAVFLAGVALYAGEKC